MSETAIFSAFIPVLYISSASNQVSDLTTKTFFLQLNNTICYTSLNTVKKIKVLPPVRLEPETTDIGFSIDIITITASPICWIIMSDMLDIYVFGVMCFHTHFNSQ